MKSEKLKINVCWICTLTVIAWIVLLIGIWSGLLKAESWKLIASVLMGGSVVGAAYKISKRQPFLLTFVPVGFLAVFALLSSWWAVFALCALVLVTLAYLFWPASSGSTALTAGESREGRTESLEKKLEDCC